MGQNASSNQREDQGKTTTISKKLVNDPVHCVTESLQGFVLTNANVKLLEGHNVVVRADLETFRKSGKVALITGKLTFFYYGHLQKKSDEIYIHNVSLYSL